MESLSNLAPEALHEVIYKLAAENKTLQQKLEAKITGPAESKILWWLLDETILTMAQTNMLQAINFSKEVHRYLPGRDISEHRDFLKAWGDLYHYVEENMALISLLENGFTHAEQVRMAGMKKIRKIPGLGKLRATRIINSVNGRGYQAHEYEKAEELAYQKRVRQLHEEKDYYYEDE
jgi:hypothetical protein